MDPETFEKLRSAILSISINSKDIHFKAENSSEILKNLEPTIINEKSARFARKKVMSAAYYPANDCSTKFTRNCSVFQTPFEERILSPSIIRETSYSFPLKKKKKVKFTLEVPHITKALQKTTPNQQMKGKLVQTKEEPDYIQKKRKKGTKPYLNEYIRTQRPSYSYYDKVSPKKPDLKTLIDRYYATYEKPVIAKVPKIKLRPPSKPLVRNDNAEDLITEGVKGTNPLKEDIFNEWLKDVIRNNLTEHGVGCKYRSSTIPWFIQEDTKATGPVYFGVLPGLYVGNFRDSKDQQQLNEHGITHILAIHDNARKLPCNNDKEYLCIIASDSPGQNLTQFFPVCNDFIHMARLKGGSVLIHCLAGMSRSVTVAVVYVMCVTSLSWRDALKAVQGARNVANPNVGFLKQLQEFEKERLHDERRRMKDKFNDKSLEVDDGQMAKDLLASYYHYMSVGEMCEGNCHPGIQCPRGLCHTSRSTGIFRRNSKETYTRPNSPLRRQGSSPSSLMPPSPYCSPEPSRNPSPTSSPVGLKLLSTNNALTPPASPSRSVRRLNCSTNLSSESSSKIRKSCSPLSEQPTPPSSPSRNYCYYTESNEYPTLSPSTSLKNKSLVRTDSSKLYRNGKIIHCPSTPPASPCRSVRKRNNAVLTPPSSPTQSYRRNSEKGSKDEIANADYNIRKSSFTSSGSAKSVIKQVLKKNASMKKASWLRHSKEVKSFDNNTSSSSLKECNQQSVPNSPSKTLNDAQSVKFSSPSRFCQVVTRLLPQLVTLNNSSKGGKKVIKSTTLKQPTDMYVDKDGKTSVKPFDADVLDNQLVSQDNDNEVVFKLCKNIRKLNIDDNDCFSNLNESTKASSSDNTNIIVNPIFSLDTDIMSKDSLMQPKKQPNAATICSAFLEDDMIYVETCQQDLKETYPTPYSDASSTNDSLFKENLPPEFTAANVNKSIDMKQNDMTNCSMLSEKPLVKPINIGDLVSLPSINKHTRHELEPKECTLVKSKTTDPTKTVEIVATSNSSPSKVSTVSVSVAKNVSSTRKLPSIQTQNKLSSGPRPAYGFPPPIPPRKNSLVKNRESTPPPIPPRKCRTTSESSFTNTNLTHTKNSSVSQLGI